MSRSNELPETDFGDASAKDEALKVGSDSPPAFPATRSFALPPRQPPASSSSFPPKPFSQFVIRVYKHNSTGTALPIVYSPFTLSQESTDNEMDEETVIPANLKYDCLIDCLVKDGGLRVPSHVGQISWVDAGWRYFITSNRLFREVCRTMRNRGDEVIRFDTWDLPAPPYEAMMARCQQFEYRLNSCCLRNPSIPDTFTCRSASDLPTTHVLVKII